MKKILIIIGTIQLIAFNASADVLNDYMSVVKNPNLTESERNGLKVIEAWRKGERPSPMTIGENGEVEIIYGLTQPQILCAVLQVTDIQLQPGETIYNVHIGDSSRWSVEPSYTGSKEGNITHLIIKPKDVDLTTSLIIGTDRRTYHIKLKSHKTEYYPMVKFFYPDILSKKIEGLKKAQEVSRSMETLETGEYLSNLDFGYRIKGSAKFKPTRVYNDGIKTIVEMPEAVKNDNMPTLLLIQKDSSDPVLVNYRLQNNRFIVDALFDEAILISGIGYKQEKIRIIRDY